ncbi:MAG: hypothetical protein ACLUKN_11395 [Bacilli bacterium]
MRLRSCGNSNSPFFNSNRWCLGDGASVAFDFGRIRNSLAAKSK